MTEQEIQDKKLSDQEKAYLEEMGPEALRRQKQLAQQLYPCCANNRSLGHHPLCKKIRGKE